MLTLAIVATAFIVLSGLLAMIDAAVLSVGRAEIDSMVKDRLFGAIELQSIKERTTRAVVVIVIATNIVNVGGPVMIGMIATERFGHSVVGIVTAILTVATVVFSEVIPKSIGHHYAPFIGRLFAPVIKLLIIVLLPVVIGLEYLAGLFKSGQRKFGTEAQIRSMVDAGSISGYIGSTEGKIIHRAFELNDRTARDIMTPVKDVVWIDADRTVLDAARLVFQSPFSRFPVRESDAKNVSGMLLSHDVLQALSEGADDASIKDLIREAPAVDATMTCDALMAMFRAQRSHLAVVRDERDIIGIVTMEDVLEELIGSIEDEKDASRN